MAKTTPEQNKALVLQAFDTLFNKRDYAAAERFWSDRYIQHSAHIALSDLVPICGRLPSASIDQLIGATRERLQRFLQA
jgi:hypothetical protein